MFRLEYYCGPKWGWLPGWRTFGSQEVGRSTMMREHGKMYHVGASVFPWRLTEVSE